jgi:RNA 3'-terminal phosphate cyclase
MALAAGESRWTTPAVTEHLRTVLWVARQFLPIEATLEEAPDGSGTVTLRGAGEG